MRYTATDSEAESEEMIEEENTQLRSRRADYARLKAERASIYCDSTVAKYREAMNIRNTNQRRVRH